MPTFLTREQLYRLIQRELPEGVYPDGQPDRYYSTAESDSVAHVIGGAYTNLGAIYEDYWPHTSVDRIGDWEITAFGKNQEAGLPLTERRDRVLTIFRSKKGLRKKDIIAVIHSIIGSDKIVELHSWNKGLYGPWLLGVALLGENTILGGAPVLKAFSPDLCTLDPAAYGSTVLERAIMRQQAYTYEVVIRGYTPTEAEDEDIEETLTEMEPARSTHLITLAPIIGGGDEPTEFGFEGDSDALGFGDLTNPLVGGTFADLNA